MELGIAISPRPGTDANVLSLRIPILLVTLSLHTPLPKSNVNELIIPMAPGTIIPIPILERQILKSETLIILILLTRLGTPTATLAILPLERDRPPQKQLLLMFTTPYFLQLQSL